MPLAPFNLEVRKHLLDAGYCCIRIIKASISQYVLTGHLPTRKHYEVVPEKEFPDLIEDDDLCLALNSKLTIFLASQALPICYWVSNDYL